MQNNDAIFEKLRAMAKPHIAQQKGFLGLMDYDSSVETHDLDKVSFPPAQSSYEDLVALAEFITPNRDELFQQKIRSKHGLLDTLYGALAGNQKICLLMAHDDITDVAKVEAEILIALCEYHASLHCGDDSPEWPLACNEYYKGSADRFHIIISTIVRSIAALGVPATDVLRKIGWVHFSFPQTESVKLAEFDRSLIRTTNQLMLDSLNDCLRQKGGLLTIAGPGSVDKQVVTNGVKIRHIQPVRIGTYQLVSDMVIVPVAAKLIGNKTFVEFGRWYKPSKMQDVHQMMHWIASASYVMTGQPTYYHTSSREFKEALAQ